MWDSQKTWVLRVLVVLRSILAHDCHAMAPKSVIGVDVGYSSLGLVCASVSSSFDDLTVQYAEKIDLRDIPCSEDCRLKHSGNVVDRMAHFVQHYQQWFDAADLILVEAQPIGGLRDVQALLYASYRHKCMLISPNSMHKHFALPKDYEERKVCTVRIAEEHLEHLRSYQITARKHDMADAFCMILFWAQQQKASHKRHRPLSKEAVNLDRFRYIKHGKSS